MIVVILHVGFTHGVKEVLPAQACQANSLLDQLFVKAQEVKFKRIAIFFEFAGGGQEDSDRL
jgi:hypothetical protein